MANVLSLAMKISADATGVRQSLSPVERALNQLDREASSVTAVFKQFGSESAAAVAAQEKFEIRVRALTESLRAGLTSPQDYARSLEQLQAAANEAADDLGRAAQIVEANLTREQRATRAYEQSIAELNRLRDAGTLDEENYAIAVQRSADTFAKATIEANKYAAASDAAGDGGALKFNELSGVLAALPGPIGNVAGRLSGLSSAGEGLARVFGGGLSQGLSSIGASVAGLVNPFTAAVAGVAGFGAAATAVTQGLTQLTGRVEELSFAARQAGVDFQTIQVLEEAATRAGVSVEALATGVQRFGARLSDAARGSGETFNALQQLGFSLEEIQQGQNDPTEFASRVAEALEQIPEPARQAQLQIDILGRGGESLVRAFGEIEGSTQAIRRFGGAISQLEANRLLELDGAFEDVQRSILGFGRELLTPFTGVAQSIAEALAPAIASFGRVLGNILDIISPFTSILGVLVNTIGQVTSVVLNLISTALEPFAAAARGISQAIDFVSQSITQAFGPINDLILSVKGFFAETFLGVEETATQTSEKVEQVATAAVEMTAEQKKAYEDLQRAVEAGNNSLDGAIEKAGEFGQAGFDAAFEFQQALEDLQEQADANELNGEQYARGVANATAEFEKQVAALEKVQEETKKAADEAKRRAEADKQVADQLLEQARIQRDFNGDTERAQAAGQVLAIERDIARARQDVEAARGDGDEQAVANGEERIRQLEEIRNQQQAIANDADGTARAEAQRLTDQKQRIDELIAAQNQQSQVERDIADVQEERARVEADRVAAVQAGRSADAQAAQERLNQLDAIQVKLDEQQRGFTNGYDEAFAATEEGFQRAVDKAAEFGLAGVEASQQLQEGIAAAQQQARSGIFTKEAYEAEVQRQNDLFDQRLEQERELAAERKKQDAERARIQQEQEQTVNALIREQFGEDPRIKAAENLKAIEAEIARAQEDAVKARDVGDKAAADAAAKRLAQLDQVQAKERDIASGAAKQREEFQNRQRQLAEAQAKQQEQIFQQQQKFAEEQAKAQQAEFDRQQKRLTELNTLGPRQVQTADVRTQEGQQLVLDLFNQQQDPQLIQLRLMNKVLNRIAGGIDRDLTRLGQPVAIL